MRGRRRVRPRGFDAWEVSASGTRCPVARVSSFASLTPPARPFRGLPPVGLAARVSSFASLPARGSLHSPAELRSAEPSLASLARSPLANPRRSLAHGSLRSPFARPAALAPLVPPWSRLTARVSSVAPLPARGSLRSPLAHPEALPSVAPRASRSLIPRPHFVRPRASRSLVPQRPWPGGAFAVHFKQPP